VTHVHENLHGITNQPTIYLPQLKQIAIRTLQTTAEGYVEKPYGSMNW